MKQQYMIDTRCRSTRSIERRKIMKQQYMMTLLFAPLIALWFIALEFTPSELAAMTIVGTFVTALMGSATAIIVAKLNKNTKLTEQTATEVADVKAKAKAIGDNVDGLKTKSDAEIQALKNENAAIKQQLIDSEKRAVALAGRPVVISTAEAPVVNDSSSLKNIEKNTAAIEKNTASTERKVDDIKESQ